MRECIFQEDCDGKGAAICEVTYAGGHVESVYGMHLNEETVQQLRDRGIVDVFLTYRGSRDILRDSGVFRDSSLRPGMVAA